MGMEGLTATTLGFFFATTTAGLDTTTPGTVMTVGAGTRVGTGGVGWEGEEGFR